MNDEIAAPSIPILGTNKRFLIRFIPNPENNKWMILLFLMYKV